MHRIGLAALSVLELTPPDMVSCASDAGFDSIGLRLIPATAEAVQHAMVGDTPLVRQPVRRIAQTALRVPALAVVRRGEPRHRLRRIRQGHVTKVEDR